MSRFLVCHTDEDGYRLRWWITLAVMLVAILDALDMTIVTVSLPDMMGSLSTNVDQVSWVLTSYGVSLAVMLPLTNLLTTRLGCRKVLLLGIAGFMVSSTLCGFAPNLLLMLVFRIGQGLFGAVLIPLSLSIIHLTFPPKEQGMGLAIYGIGLICAPILGPVIGGYITEHLTWRWIFYINLPICLLSFILSLMLIRETPTEKKKIDWLGLSLMVIGLAALQIFLDRGNSVNWYESPLITWLTIIYSVTLIAFVWRSWVIPNPIVNVRLFKNRQFSLYIVLMMGFCLLVFGQIALSPLMLQTLFHYPTVTAGLMMAPRGLGSMLAMGIGLVFMRKLNIRLSLALSLALSSVSTWLLSQLSLALNPIYYGWLSVLQGAGVGLVLLLITVFIFRVLSPEESVEGSSLLGFSRILGMSMGVSLMTALLTRHQHIYQQMLAAPVSFLNPNMQAWLQAQHSGYTLAAILARLGQELQYQAGILAFNNMTFWSACGLLPLFLLILWLKD